MDQLLQLISSLRRTDATPADLFELFANRARQRFGACATALVCTEGLDTNSCRVLSFTDHLGNLIVDNLDFEAPPDVLQVMHGSGRDAILNPEHPVVHRGDTPGIHPLFGDLFAGYIDAISLPLYQPSGVYRWCLLLFTEPGKIDAVDVERSLLLATMALNYLFSVEDARRLQEANRWIQRELDAVARIQRLLLPQDLADTPGIRVARYFKPHATVGGDYYEIGRLTDILARDNQPGDGEIWGFMIADASGHGAAAAVEIAMLDAILRTYDPSTYDGPAGVLEYANRYFFTRMLRGSFITVFASSYYTDLQQLHYANAGHPSPLIKRAGSGRVEVIATTGGIPLGIQQSQQWDNAVVDVSPGDLLVLYTDGITEAKSVDGLEFGIETLIRVVEQAPQNADECLEAVTGTLAAHTKNAEQGDDQTVVIAQVV